MDVDKHKVSGASDDHRGEVTERVGTSNASRPTVRMQFKVAGDKNLGSSSQRHEKMRVGASADNVHTPSTSFLIPSVLKKNVIGSNQSGATDASQVARGSDSNIGSSDSWLRSLQRNASAK